jgi:polyisoprenoid-binding protein YceI
MTDQSIPPGEYVLEPGTAIQFRTRHMFGLAPVKGRLAVQAGTIVVGEPVEESSATATIDAASFSTRNPMRDMPVRSRLFLHVKRHPTFEFQSESISWTGENWRVRGTLNVRGRRGPVELTIEDVKADAAGVTFRASGEIDRYAHGVGAFKGMAARKLTFDLTGRAGRRASVTAHTRQRS